MDRLIDRLPDWHDPDADAWVSRAGERAERLAPGALLRSVSGSALSADMRSGPTGAFGTCAFRRFTLALCVADWTVYATADDRVDLERLAYVVAKFPAGFRLWCAEDSDGPVPVGYTGFYPISAPSFDRLATGDPPLEDRFFHPVLPLAERPLLYIFNFSIVPVLRRAAGSDGARRMLGALDADLRAQHPSGLSAITVSDDGARVCARWGLAPTSTFVFGASVEYGHVVRLP